MISNRRRVVKLARSDGFTLIESIIVLVVLAIAAVGLLMFTGNIFSHEDMNSELQSGVKQLQECAEQILATRRQTDNANAYDQAVAVTCGAAIKIDASGTCPTGITGLTCTQLSLSIQTAGVAIPAPITLLLVK